MAQASKIHDAYRASVTGEECQDRENHAFEYVSVALPQMAFSNPRVSVSSRQRGQGEAIAKAIEHGQNRWIVDSQLRGVLARVCFDFMFSYGATVTTAAPAWQRSRSSPAFWPVCKRLSPKRFLWDAAASSVDESRWFGHVCVADKDDLIEESKKNKESGWNTAALEALNVDDGVDELGRIEDRKMNRSELVYYEMWIPGQNMPGYTPERGFHGTIYTLPYDGGSGNSKPEWIRKPRPYYGPSWGPYTLYGAYYMQDDLRPMSPLLAVSIMSQDAAKQANSMMESAKNYKRLLLVDAGQKKLTRAIKDGQHDTIIGIDGFDPKYVSSYEVGGITPQQLQQRQVVKERLDRLSGMSDALRGNATAGATATAETIAAQSATARMAYLKRQFADATQMMLRTAAWYMYHDDRVVFSLGSEEAQQLGMSAPMFVGGSLDEQMGGMSFDDLELEIDPYSMERVDEGLMQKRAMEFFGLVTQAAGMIPQAPFVDWKALFDMVGDANNYRSASDVLDVDMIRKMAGAPPMQTRATRPSVSANPTPGQQMGAEVRGAYA